MGKKWIGIFGAMLLSAATSVAAETGPTEEYWVGVHLSELGGPLRAQLNLPADKGVLVEDLVPGGPAAKAGIQRYDVLLKAADKPVRSVRDVLAVVQQAGKSGKLAVELVRAGKPKTLTLTPEKRPEGRTFNVPLLGELEGPDAGLIRNWIYKVVPEMGEDRPLKFDFIGPGQILPHGAQVPAEPPFFIRMTKQVIEAELPDGYKVTVTRQDGKPAQATVTRDKEKWEAAEGDLAKLPEKIRPHVARLLQHGGPPGAKMFVAHGPGTFGPITIKPGMVVSPLPNLDPRVEQRLHDLSAQIEELHKAVEELQKNVAEKK
jgi:hypothetical protein